MPTCWFLLLVLFCLLVAIYFALLGLLFLVWVQLSLGTPAVARVPRDVLLGRCHVKRGKRSCTVVSRRSDSAPNSARSQRQARKQLRSGLFFELVISTVFIWFWMVLVCMGCLEQGLSNGFSIEHASFPALRPSTSRWKRYWGLCMENPYIYNIHINKRLFQLAAA